MDKAHIETEKMLEIMEKHIASIYSRAYKEISEKWVEYLKKAEKKADSLLKAVSSAKTPEDKAKAERQYKAYLRSVTLQNKRYKEMVEQTANRLLSVNETALRYVNEQLPEVYVINHNGLAGVIEKDLVKEGVQGVSFTMVDENTVKKLATTNATLLPYKYINGKKDVRWNTKKINAEVLQGILQGESINTISKRLETVQDMNRVSAVRNARTMVTSAENSGRLAVFEEAEQRGLKFGKVWLATNDKRVRHAHNTLDNVMVENWRKPFEAVLWLSKTKRQPDSIMYPGDVNAHPANVYNCRCSLGYEYLGVIDSSNTTEEYNKLKSQPKAKQVAFTPANTIAGAEEYAKQFAEQVSYKGIEKLEIVNTINETLKNLIKKYPIQKLETLKANTRLSFKTEGRANYNLLELNPHSCINVKETKKILTHEYGHVIADQWFGQINGEKVDENFGIGSIAFREQQYIQRQFNKAKQNGDIAKMSEYARTNAVEFWAEAFMKYELDKPLPEAIKKMVENILSNGKV